MLTPTRERRVIPGLEVGAHQGSTDRKKPSVWRNGNLKTNRSINAVMMDTSENFLGPPGRPDGAGLHASIASAESHRVTSPRRTSACSYSGQFPP